MTDCERVWFSSPGAFIYFYSFIHTCTHCLGHYSALSPTTSLSPPTPFFQVESVLPFSLILLKRRHKHNKEDKSFLPVEIRVVILVLLPCTNVLHPKLIHL
jgi:hypothetical protein